MPAAAMLTAPALTRPSPSRVYDYLLGGKDNFAADRQAAEALDAATGREGTLRELARRDRLYLERAIGWCAGQGVSQFIDLGAGLPVPAPYRDVHEIMRDIQPQARGVYVDSDPAAVRFGRLAAAGNGTVYAEADLRDAEKVLGAAGSVTDLGRPLILVAAMVSYFLDASGFREALAGYVAAVAPGSLLVITSPAFPSGPAWGSMRDSYAATALLHGHDQETIRSFFAGTELRGCGLEFARDARPEPLTPGGATVLAGIGVKR